MALISRSGSWLMGVYHHFNDRPSRQITGHLDLETMCKKGKTITQNGPTFQVCSIQFCEWLFLCLPCLSWPLISIKGVMDDSQEVWVIYIYIPIQLCGVNHGEQGENHIEGICHHTLWESKRAIEHISSFNMSTTSCTPCHVSVSFETTLRILMIINE